jgi:hypothetical protein
MEVPVKVPVNARRVARVVSRASKALRIVIRVAQGRVKEAGAVRAVKATEAVKAAATASASQEGGPLPPSNPSIRYHLFL